MRFNRLDGALRTLLGGIIVMLALATSTAIAQQTGPVYKLYADGLACPFCAYGIEKQLSKVKGVEKIDIDISTSAVTITMAIGVELDEETAREAVEAAAFTLRDFQQVQATGQRKE